MECCMSYILDRWRSFDPDFIQMRNKSQSYNITLDFSPAPMESEPAVDPKTRNHFNIQYFEKWEQFRNTWKNVFFDEKLNHLDPDSLADFWREELTKLSQQDEKVCILVPLRVNKKEPEENKAENTQISKAVNDQNVKIQTEMKNTEAKQKQGSKQSKGGSKNKKKDNQKKQNNQVKLDQKVIDTAIQLIDKDFPALTWVYESLFLGNEKQLLIYRTCTAINRYLQKYRLPKDFRQKVDTLNKICQKIYDKKRLCNYAISTHQPRELISQYQKQLKEFKKELEKELEKFQKYLRTVFQDFKEKKRTEEIIVHSVRAEILDSLEAIVSKEQLFMGNRFFQSDLDEVRDILISKKNKNRAEEEYTPTPTVNHEQKYVYINPPREPQLPKDILDLIFIKVNLEKQTWDWRFIMPRCGKLNQFKGLYLRAPQGQGPAQVCVEVQQNTESVDISLVPYAMGKIVWEIFVWNEVGFTKSSEKIVVFNELEVKGISAPLRDYTAWIVGKSICGVKLEDLETETLEHVKLPFKCKQISISNASITSSADGDCVAWGQLYYTDNQKDQETQNESQICLNLIQNMRIEKPFKVFQRKKEIRKVSCGLGFSLMLTSFGQLWSFGFNKYGQLGLSHFHSNYYTTEPQQVSKFTGGPGSGSFLADVCATSKGSSFAIDNAGKMYRWGYNQVEETHCPIRDRFKSITNYTTANILYKNCTPTSVGTKLINGWVKQIQVHAEHFYALTKDGLLFGWGKISQLGCGVLKTLDESLVYDIINPIELMKNVDYVTTNINHTIVVTKDQQIWGWGIGEYFSNKLYQDTEKPINLTEELQGQNGKKIKKIQAGFNFTVILRENNEIDVIGNASDITVGPKDFTQPIKDVVCSKFEENFAILTQ